VAVASHVIVCATRSLHRQQTESETGKIPTITGNRRPGCVGRQLYHGHRTARVSAVRRHSDQDTVRVGLFTSRSVTGKSANIQQWITDNKLSIAALTETWQQDAASPDLIACASPGFKLVEIARARTNQLSTQTNHGDVCLFYNSTLRARVIQLSRRTTFQVVRPTYTVQGSVQSSLWSTDPAPAALLRVSSTTYWSD